MWVPGYLATKSKINITIVVTRLKAKHKTSAITLVTTLKADPIFSSGPFMASKTGRNMVSKTKECTLSKLLLT